MRTTASRRVIHRAAWVIAAGALAGCIWWGWRVIATHAIAAASVPALPDVSDRPAMLAERLNRVERGARGYVHSAAALAELARLYHANGFFDEASSCYHGLMQLEPRDARWSHLLGAILAGFGQLDQALPLLQRTVKLAPEYMPAVLRLGDAWLKTNQGERAATEYAKVLEHAPDDPYALLGLARCRIAADDWTGAWDLLQRTVAAHPKFPGAWTLFVMVDEHFGLASTADEHRRHAQTLGRFREAPDPWLDALVEECYDPYRLAVAAAASADLQTAQRWLERATALASAPGFYHQQLGDRLLRAKQYAAAHAQLNKAVALAPDDVEAWVLLIDVREKLGDRAGATQALTTGLVHCPQSPALHFYRGKMFKEAGQFAEAAVALEKSIRLQPNEARAYIELATVEFQLGRIEQGMARIQAALVAEPGNAFAMQVMARYAITTHDEPTAREWMQRLHRHAGVSAVDRAALTHEFHRQFGQAP